MPIILSIVLALGLWGYVSLTSPSTVYVTYPLIIDLPEERSLEMEPPVSISVKLRTSGWQLLYLQYFSSGKECRIDVEKAKVAPDGIVELTKSDILQGINPSVSLEKVVEVLPENIMLKTGMLFRQSVPVQSRISINPAEGYMVIGKVKIEPDSIVLRGNGSIIPTLRSWATANMSFSDLTGPFSFTVPLQDSLQNLVTSAVKEVVISGDIQQIAEITIDDVPIIIAGAPSNSEHSIEPSRISLHIRGGVRRLASLSPDDIKAIVYYPQLIEDSSGFIAPTFVIPAGITVIGTNPKTVKHRLIMYPKP
ncbi:MAG: CdaR family protein [Ignavibacteria bacterium]